MKKIVRLTENDLTKIVKKVIKEQINDVDDRRVFDTNAEQIELTRDDVRNGFPDFSDYKQLDVISCRNCGLTEMPSKYQLPKGLMILNLEYNQIKTASLFGYGDFESLYVINLANNPLEEIDTYYLGSLLSSNRLTRFAISNPQNLLNYEEYVSVVRDYERRNPNSSLYIDID